jgi:methionine-S-sulfoxide reductase
MTANDAGTLQTTYLAGGCFWGMQDLLRRIPGVVATEVGYSGGNTTNPDYEQVRTGRTGHAESVKILFDPEVLSYRHLLFEFFRMHDPTTPDRQGNDTGSQYRSAIFCVNDEQLRSAAEVIAAVNDSQDWRSKVVTEVLPFRGFTRAEEYHQDYLLKHPQGYTCHYVRKLDLGERA